MPKTLVFLRLFTCFLTFGATVCASADAPKEAISSEKSTVLRVMTFNIRNSGARDGENHWSKRKDLVISAIRMFDPDLLGLQEVLADQFDELVNAFPDYTAIGVARDDGARKGEWSAIFYRKSRFGENGSGTFWLSDTPEKIASFGWDAACVRICTWSRLQDLHTQKSVLFANTHFDHEGKVARINSARLLRERLPQLAGSSPIILAGDFNCTEESEPYQIFTGQEVPGTTASNSSGLVDSFRAVRPDRTNDEASFHGFKGTKDGLRIDWILHSKELTPIAADIDQRSTKTGRYPSDHNPVTAILK